MIGIQLLFGFMVRAGNIFASKLNKENKDKWEKLVGAFSVLIDENRLPTKPEQDTIDEIAGPNTGKEFLAKYRQTQLKRHQEYLKQQEARSQKLIEENEQAVAQAKAGVKAKAEDQALIEENDNVSNDPLTFLDGDAKPEPSLGDGEDEDELEKVSG